MSVSACFISPMDSVLIYRRAGHSASFRTSRREGSTDCASFRASITFGFPFIFENLLSNYSDRIRHVTGEVFPSGFLALTAGNVRSQPLGSIYRDSPLFRSLRDTAQLEGKCGHCEFKEVCGGSRSRAYALTGDPMAEEPCCSYIPKGYAMPPPTVRTASTLHVLQGA